MIRITAALTAVLALTLSTAAYAMDEYKRMNRTGGCPAPETYEPSGIPGFCRLIQFHDGVSRYFATDLEECEPGYAPVGRVTPTRRVCLRSDISGEAERSFATVRLEK
jgi:hypothetical protein